MSTPAQESNAWTKRVDMDDGERRKCDSDLEDEGIMRGELCQPGGEQAWEDRA